MIPAAFRLVNKGNSDLAQVVYLCRMYLARLEESE